MLLSCPCGHRHDQALSLNVSNSRKKYKVPSTKCLSLHNYLTDIAHCYSRKFLNQRKNDLCLLHPQTHSPWGKHALTLTYKGKKEIIVLWRFIYYLCVWVFCLHISDVHRVCLMITVGSRGCLSPGTEQQLWATMWALRFKTRSSAQQWVLLTIGPTLQPKIIHFLKKDLYIYSTERSHRDTGMLTPN